MLLKLQMLFALIADLYMDDPGRPPRRRADWLCLHGSKIGFYAALFCTALFIVALVPFIELWRSGMINPVLMLIILILCVFGPCTLIWLWRLRFCWNDHHYKAGIRGKTAAWTNVAALTLSASGRTMVITDQAGGKAYACTGYAGYVELSKKLEHVLVRPQA